MTSLSVTQHELSVSRPSACSPCGSLGHIPSNAPRPPRNVTAAPQSSRPTEQTWAFCSVLPEALAGMSRMPLATL